MQQNNAKEPTKQSKRCNVVGQKIPITNALCSPSTTKQCNKITQNNAAIQGGTTQQNDIKDTTLQGSTRENKSYKGSRTTRQYKGEGYSKWMLNNTTIQR